MMMAAAASPAAAAAMASAEPPETEIAAVTAQGEEAEAPLLVLHRAAPCLTGGGAAAAVLVDGPHAGPYGWTSVASQDGQLRILATGAFLSSGSSSSGTNNNTKGASPSSPPPPLMLAHVLRPSEPAGPGPLLGHAWATTVPDASDAATPGRYHHLATLHRQAVLLHGTRGPASPPAPWATLRPCAEARALDLCIFAPCSSEPIAAGAAGAAGAIAAAASGETLLVAVGGSFGLEVHHISTAPLSAATSSQSAATATPPISNRVAPARRLLPRASVSLLRYSPCGRWLAVASLDGRVGVLDVAAEGLLLSHDNDPSPIPPTPSSTSAWACAVVRGERATGLAFAHDGRRLAVACADGNVLMLRLRRERWEPCPVFLASLRATRSAAAATASTASAVSGGPHSSGPPSLPCWPALAWSPNDRRLAVSLPGAGGPCAPELAVLDAASGARLGAVPLARSVQGMVAASSGGCVHCVNEAGALRVYRWAGEMERRAKAAAASSALVACTLTAAAWRLANRDGKEGLRLRWRRRRRRGQQWETVEISAPFLPTDALAPVAAGQEQEKGEEGSGSGSSGNNASGRVVVGEDVLLVLFPGVAYLCGWPAAQEKGRQQQQHQQGDWHMFAGWEPSHGALLAATCVESGGGGRVLALVAARQDACEREVLLQLLSRGVESAPPGLRLALPQKGWKEPARWTVLTCPSLPLSFSASFSSSSAAAPAAFVVVAVSSGAGSGLLCVWRGSVDAGGGFVALDDLPATTPLRVGCPPLRPGAVLLPVELLAGRAAAKARAEVRCWEFGTAAEAEEEEVGSGGGVRCCWVLELGVDVEQDEDEGEGEGLGWSWRMMRVGTTASLPDPLAAAPDLEPTSQNHVYDRWVDR